MALVGGEKQEMHATRGENEADGETSFHVDGTGGKSSGRNPIGAMRVVRVCVEDGLSQAEQELRIGSGACDR